MPTPARFRSLSEIWSGGLPGNIAVIYSDFRAGEDGRTTRPQDRPLGLAEAEHAAVPMPGASLVYDRFGELVTHEWAEPD